LTGSAAAVGPTVARATVPQNHVLVLFGATGDLAKRKLLPGLFHLAVAGMMPERYRIVGSGRPDGALDTEGFRSHVRDALNEFGGRELTDEQWGRSLNACPSRQLPPSIRTPFWTRSRTPNGTSGPTFAGSSNLAVPPHAFAPMARTLRAPDPRRHARRPHALHARRRNRATPGDLEGIAAAPAETAALQTRIPGPRRHRRARRPPPLAPALRRG
jgi:hypothetical protein